MPNTRKLVIGAVGDLSFRGRHENNATPRVFHEVKPVFDQVDCMIANLESPLTSLDSIPVPGKCTLRGTVEWAEILKEAGLQLVSLANNHMMDYGEEGLSSTIAALNEVGIAYVGAGKNRQEACRPVFKKIAERSAAFLARSFVDVSSLCYAGENQPGVAFLEEKELVSSIKKSREHAELIVVMVHWGMEHYRYPSSRQRSLANKMVSAGADIVLGHHPHVLQGEEMIGDAVVSYSSGNFLFDEFPWSVCGEDGKKHIYQSTLTEHNRQGMILEICLSVDGAISTKQIFTKISADALVELDASVARRKEYEKLCSRLALPLYDKFWKIYSIKREWDLRLSSQLAPGKMIRKFHKIRPRHFKELAVKIRRSAKVSSGKSTNPYEG